MSHLTKEVGVFLPCRVFSYVRGQSSSGRRQPEGALTAPHNSSANMAQHAQVGFGGVGSGDGRAASRCRLQPGLFVETVR